MAMSFEEAQRQAQAGSGPAGSMSYEDALAAAGGIPETPPPPPPAPLSIMDVLHHPITHLGDFTDVIPGVKDFRANELTPLADAIKTGQYSPMNDQGQPSMLADLLGPDNASSLVHGIVGGGTDALMTPPLQTGSTAVNFASGVPGNIASMLGDLGAANIQSGPENLALMGTGAAARATGAIGLAGKAIDATPGLSQVKSLLQKNLEFRGGLLPQSKEAMATYDLATQQGKQEAIDLASKIMTAGAGKRLTPDEGKFMDTLLNQPDIRQAIQSMTEEDFPANRAALHEMAGPVPGRPTFAPHLPPELSAPVKSFNDVAQEVAVKLNQKFSTVADLLEKDPDELSRMTDLNYSPIAYAGDRLGTMRTVSSMIREKTGFLKMRRDLSESAMKELGYVEDPTGPVSIRMEQMNRTINTRNLFNTLAADPEVVRMPASPQEMTMDAGFHSDGFTKMGKDASLGPLAGQMVRKAEAAEINATVRRQNPGTMMAIWKPIFAAWRFGKTVLNPATHVNNAFGNVMLADQAGLSPWNVDVYSRAIREATGGGPFWEELKQVGAPWTTGGGTQMTSDIMDIRNSIRGGEPVNAYEAFARGFHKVVTDNAISKRAAQLYSSTEGMFKTAIYINQRQQGMAMHDAMRYADAALFNYDQVPQFVKQLRTTAIPFVTFTYKAIPSVATAMVERPQVFLRYKLFVDTWNAAAAESAGISKKDQADIEAFFPGAVPMISPFRSSTGSPMVYDVARKTPYQDFMPGRQGSLLGPGGGVMGVATGLPMRNPLISEAVAQLQGKDLQGAPFAPPLGAMGQADQVSGALGVDPKDMAIMKALIQEPSSRGAHAARTFLPEAAGGGAFQNVASAIKGKKDYAGSPVSVPRAIIESIMGKGRALDQQQKSAEGNIKGLRDVAKQLAKNLPPKEVEAILQGAK